MKTFEFEGELVNLCYTYDALTIYTKFELTHSLVLAPLIASCNQLEFVECDENLTEQAEKFKEAKFRIKNENLAFDRNVHRNDDDHSLYHLSNQRNGFSENDEHFHLKFSILLSYDHMEMLLDIFSDHQIISEHEKSTLLKLFSERYIANQSLIAALNCDPEEDAKKIISYIANCDDNDVLFDLHERLLSNEFDYMKHPEELSKNRTWQGVNEDGDIVPTSLLWAMIEKSIALKMAKNILTALPIHTPELSKERANQLSQYSFFAMKRKSNEAAESSKMYHAFHDNEIAKFDKSYEHHFNKM